MSIFVNEIAPPRVCGQQGQCVQQCWRIMTGSLSLQIFQRQCFQKKKLKSHNNNKNLHSENKKFLVHDWKLLVSNLWPLNSGIIIENVNGRPLFWSAVSMCNPSNMRTSQMPRKSETYLGLANKTNAINLFGIKLHFSLVNTARRITPAAARKWL